jgi:hypothetical protein
MSPLHSSTHPADRASAERPQVPRVQDGVERSTLKSSASQRSQFEKTLSRRAQCGSHLSDVGINDQIQTTEFGPAFRSETKESLETKEGPENKEGSESKEPEHTLVQIEPTVTNANALQQQSAPSRQSFDDFNSDQAPTEITLATLPLAPLAADVATGSPAAGVLSTTNPQHAQLYAQMALSLQVPSETQIFEVLGAESAVLSSIELQPRESGEIDVVIHSASAQQAAVLEHHLPDLQRRLAERSGGSSSSPERGLRSHLRVASSDGSKN